jgi:hypothetical protein
MIRMLVGRCHVGESYRSVIRYVSRKALLREIVKEHRENRQLYRNVEGDVRCLACF